MFFDELPNALKQTGLSLHEMLGTYEFAWNYEEAKKVILYLAEHNYAILGGDVLRWYGEILFYTYDNWYQNRDATTSWAIYMEQCKEKALSYIDFYHDRNDDGYYYVPVAIQEEGWHTLYPDELRKDS